ncbi:MAG: alpha amylase C-terminal domain-containing protein, partial [Planctomycetaceae bacterium]|nr:alpha amylase C-terminal domain-containing protein [Planctomycetaceae bacterium]
GGRENLEAIEFLRQMNTVLHHEFPGILTIAEESTAWPGVSRPCYTGGLGFTMKWDMGWMNDTLRFMRRDSIHRRFHLNDLTFRGVYAFSENFMLPLSHDEVVHGKQSLLSQMSGDQWQKFANLRLLLSYQFACPGKKLQFMGTEFGQWTEWNHDTELDWALRKFDTHEGIRRLVCDLNRLYRSEPAMHQADTRSEGFEWVVGDDSVNTVTAFLRHSADRRESVLVVMNLTPVPRDHYQLGVPAAGFYKEILNTDAKWYAGSGIGNTGGVYSRTEPSHGRKNSIRVTLPPLATCIFKLIPGAPPEPAKPKASTSQAKPEPGTHS